MVANYFLEKIGRNVTALEQDFSDGVNILLLIGLLEGMDKEKVIWDVKLQA